VIIFPYEVPCGGERNFDAVMRGVVVSRGEDVGVYYVRGGRGVLRVYSAGVMDAGGFVREMVAVCGGEGGGSKKSAVWTVKREEVV